MAKVNYYVTGVNHKVTPEMVEHKDARVPKDVYKYISAIAKATKQSENSLYITAYSLDKLNTPDISGASPIKKMGYKNIGEYAETFHNIANSTALAYAQTARELLVKDEFGIHSPLASIDAETGKILHDFTVTQLQELRGIDSGVLDAMMDNGAIGYGMRTKALRLRKQAVKYLTDSASPYFIGEPTAQEIADAVVTIAEYALEHKCDNAVKALEMMHSNAQDAQDAQEAQDTAQDAQEAQDTAQDAQNAQNTAQGAQNDPENMLTALESLVHDAVNNYPDYADMIRSILENGLDMIAELGAQE